MKNRKARWIYLTRADQEAAYFALQEARVRFQDAAREEMDQTWKQSYSERASRLRKLEHKLAS